MSSKSERVVCNLCFVSGKCMFYVSCFIYFMSQVLFHISQVSSLIYLGSGSCSSSCPAGSAHSFSANQRRVWNQKMETPNGHMTWARAFFLSPCADVPRETRPAGGGRRKKEEGRKMLVASTSNAHGSTQHWQRSFSLSSLNSLFHFSLVLYSLTLLCFYR